MKPYLRFTLKPRSTLIASFIYILLSLTCLQSSWAENKIYGSLRYDYQKGDKSPQVSFDKNGLSSSGRPGFHSSGSHKDPKNRRSNIGDAGSRIGIDGRHDIGEGNAIIYNLEWGFDGLGNSY